MLTFFVKGGAFCIDSCSDKCMYLNYIKCCELLLSPFWDLEESNGCENFAVKRQLLFSSQECAREMTWHGTKLRDFGRSVRWPWMWVSGKIRGIVFDFATGKTTKTCAKDFRRSKFHKRERDKSYYHFSLRSIIRNHEPLKNHGWPIMILWDFWYFCNCKPRTSLLFYPFSALGHRRCSALCKRSNLGWSAPSRIKTFFSLCSRFLYSQELTIVTMKHGRPRELLY